MVFEFNGVDEKIGRCFDGRERLAFFDFRFAGRMSVEKVLYCLVQRRISDESTGLSTSEFLDRLQFRQRLLRKYQPKFLDALLRIKFEPRLFRNLDHLAGWHE